jgi:hypothetical protein
VLVIDGRRACLYTVASGGVVWRTKEDEWTLQEQGRHQPYHPSSRQWSTHVLAANWN